MLLRATSSAGIQWLGLADFALTIGWIASSVLLFGAILFGRWRVAREKRRARAGKVQGHDVLMTEDLGPAVAGIRQPVVFVPRWVVALDDSSQRLLLAHEVEHVRRRDTGMLMAGAALTALVPWNPVAWWQARRLRIAVELDCDARVLAAHPDVRRYADLLLVAAGKPKFTSRFLAAHFGEHLSDLERRIDAMTNSTWQFRSLVLAATAAVGLTVASCEAPRPEPLAPGKAKQGEAPTVIAEGTDYYEFQVEKPVSRTANSPSPRYPEILREAGVEGEALVSFVVDETGLADPASFKVVRSTHELFSTAVREALPAMRFTPAEVGGKKVRQMVQAPFSFAIAGNKVQSGEIQGSMNATYITGVPGGRRGEPMVIRRSDASSAMSPNVVVYSIDGKELARAEGGGGLLKGIAPESIHSIEVVKGSGCAPLGCPLIKITLAKGKTLGPPQRFAPVARRWRRVPEQRESARVDRAEVLSSKMNRLLLARARSQRVMGAGTLVREVKFDDISASRPTMGRRESVSGAAVR